MRMANRTKQRRDTKIRAELDGARRSFVLRLWRPDHQGEWRAMLSSVDGRLTQQFMTVTQLAAYLEGMNEPVIVEV